MLLPCFLAENKVYLSAYVHIRKGGSLYYLVLITKIKATEILCSFVPEKQIPKYPFSVHCKYFHAFNST